MDPLDGLSQQMSNLQKTNVQKLSKCNRPIFQSREIPGGYQVFFFKDGPTPASSIVYFRSFQTNTIKIFTTNICEKYSGIRTHDLWNMSLLHWPLDQGSRPIPSEFRECHLSFTVKICFLLLFNSNTRFVQIWIPRLLEKWRQCFWLRITLDRPKVCSPRLT